MSVGRLRNDTSILCVVIEGRISYISSLSSILRFCYSLMFLNKSNSSISLNFAYRVSVAKTGSQLFIRISLGISQYNFTFVPAMRISPASRYMIVVLKIWTRPTFPSISALNYASFSNRGRTLYLLRLTLK